LKANQQPDSINITSGPRHASHCLSYRRECIEFLLRLLIVIKTISILKSIWKNVSIQGADMALTGMEALPVVCIRLLMVRSRPIEAPRTPSWVQ
ncbi:MAG: hypothetical protein ACK6BC_13465, partial [Cyanobacteriota bacterium]